MAVLRVARNVGFAAGSLLAAAALATANPLASRALIAVDALTFLYAAAAMRAPGLRAAGRPVPPAGVDGPRRQPATTALRDRRYLFATLLNGVLSVHMTLLAVGIPVWVVTHTRAPAALVGMLLGINTVLAMLLQVPASRYATSLAAAARSLAASGALLALACTLLAAAARVPPAWAVAVLVTAVLAHTAAELLQSAGGWTLSYELAPGARQSTYLSVFNLGVSVQRAAGPALVTGIVIAHGTAGWLGLAALLCLTALSGMGQGMWRGSPGLTPAPRRPAHRREKARHRRPPQPAASRRTRVPGRPSRTARAELRTASPPGA
jgi:hypothetical protein